MPYEQELINEELERVDKETNAEANKETVKETPKEEAKDEPTGEKKDAPEAKTEELTAEEIEKKKKEELVKGKETIATEAKEEGKIEGKKEGEVIAEKKAEEEIQKDWWDTKEEKKEEPTVETNKDTKAKLAEYDKLLTDPEIKAFIEAKKAGKTLRSFVNELKGVDPESLSPEQLYETQLKALNLTTEEYDEEMDKFKELSKVIQLNTTKPIKEELLKEQNERLSKFSTEASETSKKDAERTTFIHNKATKDLDEFIKGIEGADFLGVKITPEIAEGLKVFTDKDFNIYNADGTYNVPYMVELGLFTKYRKELMTENIERATEKGKEEILKEVTRPSQEIKGTQRMPDLLKAAEEDVRAAEEQAMKANPVLSNGTPIPTN